MSSVRDMIDAIAIEDFDAARTSLKTSLAEYMAGTKYVSNKEIFGDKYENPNEEEQKSKDELSEAKKKCKKKKKDEEMVKENSESDENFVPQADGE